MEMDHSAFDWTLNYDEVDYIIEGRLEVRKDGRTTSANKGEVIFIPKGSSITFSAPDFVRFMYVTYPADWANQK
jgi:ethanolamine utilization protein EutQ